MVGKGSSRRQAPPITTRIKPSVIISDRTIGALAGVCDILTVKYLGKGLFTSQKGVVPA
jgi:hypothetical protein